MGVSLPDSGVSNPTVSVSRPAGGRGVSDPVSGITGSAGGGLGPELVSNGNFATDTVWSKNNTTISGGACHWTGTNGTVQQALTLSAGATYQVQFTILNFSAGAPVPLLYGGANVTGTSVSSNGTYTQELVATADSLGIRIAGGTSPTFDLDDVSVRRVL